MESSIAVFLLRQPACERLPTCDAPEGASGTRSGGRGRRAPRRRCTALANVVVEPCTCAVIAFAPAAPAPHPRGAITRRTRWQPHRIQHKHGPQRCSDQRRTRKHHIAERDFDPRTFAP